MRKRSRSKTTATILKQYDKRSTLYRGFADALRNLVTTLLEAEGIQVHSVTCRLKTKQSLSEKLSQAPEQYEHLEDVTDICGVRVITYFPDVVDQVAALLEREFVVDTVNSIDKRRTLDPDRFGYLSLHHIVSLRPERAALAEYRKFIGLKVEIQTRSILQHAWAEIEHDLGYKVGQDVPRNLRRRFARLAGLLELADEEFTQIRDALREYERRVRDQIEAAPTQVTLDKASIMAFVATNEIVQALDRAVTGSVEAELHDVEMAFFTGDAERFGHLGIASIADLEEAIRRRRTVIEEFAREWLKGSKHEWLARGISLFYLWYVLLAETGSATRSVANSKKTMLGLPRNGRRW